MPRSRVYPSVISSGNQNNRKIPCAFLANRYFAGNQTNKMNIFQAQKTVDRIRAKSRLPRAAIKIIGKNEFGWKIEMNLSVWQMKSHWEPGMAIRIPDVLWNKNI